MTIAKEFVELIEENSTIIAFAVAPFITTVFWGLADMLINPEANVGAGSFGGLLWIYTFMLCPTLIFGGPTYFLAKRLGLVTWWAATLTGLISGAIIWHLFGVLKLLFIPLGGLNGFIFWLVWKVGHKVNGVRHH